MKSIRSKLFEVLAKEKLNIFARPVMYEGIAPGYKIATLLVKGMPLYTLEGINNPRQGIAYQGRMTELLQRKIREVKNDTHNF